MSDTHAIIYLVINLIAIAINIAAIVKVRSVVQLLDADNDALRARRDALRAELDAGESAPAGKRLITELDRVQSMQFGVPMTRVPRTHGPYLDDWDGNVPAGLELHQPRRSSRTRA